MAAFRSLQTWLAPGLVVLALGSMTSNSRADERTPTPDELRFFETSIRPVLVEHCQKCHGAQKQRADLRLDSRQRILKGGESGPAAIPGQPAQSLLVQAIRHLDESRKMPPDKKLTDRQIADLTQWVQMGLPYPDDGTQKASETNPKDWWAFQSPRDPAVPKVRDSAWPQGALDHFILAKLEAQGLKPAPPADRRTLLRRATFDLIGLPPTPDEIDAFVNDRTPDAFAKVVDRLLASHHYGERWGRHWLDIARYADSNGLDENVAFGTAWRYRDYVVAAFNHDLPFDQFVIEQLAGDLLTSSETAQRHRRLIATGFLSLGPKVIAEVDEKKMEMDIVDEQIDTVGRTFMALTLGCARCHDHKFDPVPTSDYYGLAGIFQSTRTMEHFKKIARWHEHSLATESDLKNKADHDKEIARRKAVVQAFVAKATDDLKAKMPNSPKIAEALFPAETKAELKRLRDELTKYEKAAPEISTALGVADGPVVDAPIHPRGNHLKRGALVPRHMPSALVAGPAPAFDSKHSGRLELARWLTRPEHPLTGRVLVNRIWNWHFGNGLVRSIDNFGLLGERPDNQELLDWLTRRFIESGWSIKSLHRWIVLSSTYQMSATPEPSSLERDPDNRLQGRAAVRRLDAEGLRDAILAVTGTLDKSVGGSLLHVKNREYLFDHTSRDLTRYDSKKRSLYLPVIRNNVYDVFQLFDFPDPAVPNGSRATTTVAPQALFLLNSAWVMQCCDAWAESLLSAPGRTDADRIDRAYRSAYGRRASEAESTKAVELISAVERALTQRESNPGRRRLLAWSAFCQVTLSANEFAYYE